MEMITLRNAVLATLTYYDAFSMPLTLVEVWKHLINPTRLNTIPGGLGEIKLVHVLAELRRLEFENFIEARSGFYMMKGKGALYETRMRRYNISDQKWKKFLRLCRWLSGTPYLAGLFASGSMAMGNTDNDSDFDVLIIARENRLYTCRLFLWLIASLLRARRGRFQEVAPNKLCFNHYITENHLRIPHESLFNAQMYANLKPVWMRGDIVERFYAANIWLNTYVYNFKPQKDFVYRSIVAPKLACIVAGICEVILNTSVGDWIERILKQYQHARIRKNPVTYEPGGRIVFTDHALEFHPRSFERIVLARYKSALVQLGITPAIEEKDSGLQV